jgi:hypothetical protein
VDKEVASFVPRPNYITTTPAFTKIQKEVAGMHAYTAREVSSGVWKSQSPNQTVGSGVNQAAGAAVSNVDLDTSSSWTTLRGSGFSIAVPAKWQSYGNQTSAMLAPPGGIARSTDGGAGTVIYGVLTDVYQPQGRVTIEGALDELVNNIARDNTGLVPGRQTTEVTANGVAGRGVECNIPSANNGKGEHDWIVAFPQRNGALRYFAFVAPTSDFEALRPAFVKMLQTLTVN